MRLDVFLKLSRIIKQREAAKKACDLGMVTMNGRPAKPAHEVLPGARFRVEWPDRRIEVEVLEIPSGNVSRARSQTLYRLLDDQTTEAPDTSPER